MIWVRLWNKIIVVRGTLVAPPPIQIPGIGTVSAYAAGDAFGDKFTIKVPKQGVISTAVFLDKDDEGITKELVLFSKDFVAVTDNAAFAIRDHDLERVKGVIDFDDFRNYGNNQVCVAYPALYYEAPEGRLWGQFVTRGADNIAVGALPEFFMVVSQ